MSRSALIAAIGFATAAAALTLAVSLDFEGEGRPGLVPAPAPATQMPPAVAEPRAMVPSFDVIRIGQHGDAVLAGRAAPRAEVVLLDADRELGSAQADERGEWVFVPNLPMPPGARALGIVARNPDGSETRSPKPVLLVVPESAAEPALAVAPLPEGGARLMAGPGGEPSAVSVDLVDRDAGGGTFMGGRAQPGALIHLYMDNVFLGRAKADAEGSWRLAAKAAPGTTLRADLVDGTGKVLARLELPLAPEATQAGEGVVVVEPGQSQWTIARKLGGEGPASTIIYRPNKDNMRDPDRIYPGQVFLVPKN